MKKFNCAASSAIHRVRNLYPGYTPCLCPRALAACKGTAAHKGTFWD